MGCVLTWRCRLLSVVGPRPLQSERDGARFDEDLYSLLTRPTGFEAVMRVRVTRGLKVVQFHGSYYIRGTDLLALPNCSTESVFAVELAHEEAFLTASVICVQTALLHTTSSGERRIRVHTLAAPVSQIIQVQGTSQPGREGGEARSTFCSSS